jgi:predicted exporter
MTPQPPDLPPVLLKPWPVIAVITTGWVIATVLAFAVPGLHELRPYAVAGLGVGALGTSIFLLQRRAVRRGSRGAQSGLD